MVADLPNMDSEEELKSVMKSTRDDLNSGKKDVGDPATEALVRQILVQLQAFLASGAKTSGVSSAISTAIAAESNPGLLMVAFNEGLTAVGLEETAVTVADLNEKVQAADAVTSDGAKSDDGKGENITQAGMEGKTLEAATIAEAGNIGIGDRESLIEAAKVKLASGEKVVSADGSNINDTTSQTPEAEAREVGSSRRHEAMQNPDGSVLDIPKELAAAVGEGTKIASIIAAGEQNVGKSAVEVVQAENRSSGTGFSK